MACGRPCWTAFFWPSSAARRTISWLTAFAKVSAIEPAYAAWTGSAMSTWTSITDCWPLSKRCFASPGRLPRPRLRRPPGARWPGPGRGRSRRSRGPARHLLVRGDVGRQARLGRDHEDRRQRLAIAAVAETEHAITRNGPNTSEARTPGRRRTSTSSRPMNARSRVRPSPGRGRGGQAAHAAPATSSSSRPPAPDPLRCRSRPGAPRPSPPGRPSPPARRCRARPGW